MPPLPVPEPFARALNEVITGLTDLRATGLEALKIGEADFLQLPTGRRGMWRAPVDQRFVPWTVFITRLVAALVYVEEFLIDELENEHVRRPVIGFDRPGDGSLEEERRTASGG